MENENKERNSFTGSLGFVLAAAGSAVGLGNIWRFPYCAAKDGGGLFLLIYLVFALTFGFALLIASLLEIKPFVNSFTTKSAFFVGFNIEAISHLIAIGLSIPNNAPTHSRHLLIS